MRKASFLLPILGLLAFISLPTTSAHAQATRTWVSGVGDDANPCSRTAPCKTFAGAISKTAAGGEIDCLDPGGFGAVTITKAITIDCGPNAGGILAASVNGVIINAGVNDKVVLRNLFIQGTTGTTPGLNGIRWLAGLELELYNVTISGFTTLGLDVSKTALGVLSVRKSYFSEVPTAIRLATTASNVVASISDTSFNFVSANGVQAASANAFAAINDSVFSAAGGSGAIASASGATVNVSNSTFANCGTGINASVSGAKITANGNTLVDNTVAFNAAAGATFLSGGDNKVSGNAGSNQTGAMVIK